MSLEEHKRRERAQAIGLFRYQLICPALDEGLSSKQRGKLVREIAARAHALTAAFAADHAIVDEKAARIAISETATD